MNVGNGKRDLPSQNFGNTMLKLQPPMNPCACGAHLLTMSAHCHMCIGTRESRLLICHIVALCMVDLLPVYRYRRAQGPCLAPPCASFKHPGVALPCRSQAWQVAGVFTPMGNSYPVRSPDFHCWGHK